MASRTRCSLLEILLPRPRNAPARLGDRRARAHEALADLLALRRLERLLQRRRPGVPGLAGVLPRRVSDELLERGVREAAGRDAVLGGGGEEGLALLLVDLAVRPGDLHQRVERECGEGAPCRRAGSSACRARPRSWMPVSCSSSSRVCFFCERHPQLVDELLVVLVEELLLERLSPLLERVAGHGTSCWNLNARKSERVGQVTPRASGGRPRRGSRARRDRPGAALWPRPRPAIRNVRSTTPPQSIWSVTSAPSESVCSTRPLPTIGVAPRPTSIFTSSGRMPATTRAPIGASDTEQSRMPGPISTTARPSSSRAATLPGSRFAMPSSRAACGVAGRRSTSSRGPSCTSRPVDQHGDALGEQQRLAQVVAHESDGRARVADRRAQIERERLARGDVEIVEGLVEQQHARLAHEGLGERHAAHLAAGERRSGAPGEAPRARSARAPRAARRAACARGTPAPQSGARTLKATLPDEHDRPLEDQRHRALRRCARTRPLARGLEPGERAQQRGLARAVRDRRRRAPRRANRSSASIASVKPVGGAPRSTRSSRAESTQAPLMPVRTAATR